MDRTGSGTTRALGRQEAEWVVWKAQGPGCAADRSFVQGKDHEPWELIPARTRLSKPSLGFAPGGVSLLAAPT